MADVLIGVTDRTVLVFIPDPASASGQGKTGLTAADMTVSYTRVETDNDVVVTDVTSSLSTLSALTDAHTDWGWKEVSSTLAPGLYRLDIADAVFASGAWSAVVQAMITSGTAAPTPKQFDLVAYNPLDGVRLGLTALPNAAAEAAGGLYTRGTGAGQITQSSNGLIDVRLGNATHGDTNGDVTIGRDWVVTRDHKVLDDVVVTGNHFVMGSLAVTGAFAVGSIYVDTTTTLTGAVALGGHLTITGGVTMSDLTVNNNVGIAGDLTVQGNQTVVGALGVGSVTVTGTTTLGVVITGTLTTGNVSTGTVTTGTVVTGSFTTGSVSLSALTVAGAVTATHVSNSINLGTGAITAGVIAPDAIGASELAADAATEIGTAVWATAARTLTAATNITSTGGPITVSSGSVSVYDLTTAAKALIQTEVQDGITAEEPISAQLANNVTHGGPAADVALNNTTIFGAFSVVGAVTMAASNIIDLGSAERSSIATAVWAAGTRTLTSFGTLVADIATAVWAAASRTLTAFGFTPTPSNAADTTAIKAKTDLLTFNGTSVSSNVTKVNDASVTGTGASGDEWGPS